MKKNKDVPIIITTTVLRKYSDRDRSGFRFVDARAAPLVSSRLETETESRRRPRAAHALVTFAASMSVTAFLPARTCVWTRSMAALDSLSSCAARADESPLRERNRL